MKTRYREISRITGVFAVMCLLLSSCIKEQLDDSIGITPGSETKVKLRIEIPGHNATQSRTTGEITDIEHIVIMTFDSNGNMTDAPCEAEADLNSENLYYVSGLKKTSEARQVVIVVNSNAALSTYLASSTAGFPNGSWKVMGEPGVTTTNATKLTHLKNNLQRSSLRTATISEVDHAVEQPVNAPMAGQVTLPSGIDGSVIANTGGTPIQLVRATAKYTVEVVGDIPNFQILGASIGTMPLAGYVFSNTRTDLKTTSIASADASSTNTAASYVPLVGAENAKLSEPMFSYEVSASVKPFVILKASYNGITGYYRLDIADNGSPRKSMDIVRNTWYKIEIRKVDSKGYANFSEAMLLPSFNIESKVVVGNSSELDDAHDIVSNGQYYLGVSNSEFVVYTDEDIVVPAFTVTHNAPVDTPLATVSIMGGMSIHNSQTGLTNTNPSLAKFNTCDGTPQKVDVLIVVSKTVSQSTATIRIGNLEKVVKIYRRSVLPFSSGVLSDFADAEYVTGTLTGTANWMKLSTSYDSPSSSSEAVNPAGGIYVKYNRNVGPGAAKRSGAIAYFARNSNQGRVKAYFLQSGIDPDNIVNTDPTTVNANFKTYVGAFWKRDQTGERLIRITRPTANGTTFTTEANGDWTATVLEGEDWIVLDKVMTTDPNVGWKSSPPDVNNVHNGNDPDFDRNHPVTGGMYSNSTISSRSVSGTLGSTAGNTEIYFRIGLKSQYTGTNGYDPIIAPARYGVVLLTYRGNTLSQRIFIRQGEDPDYLYKRADRYENDPNVPGTSFGNWRPSAVRFSPYNLTAETLDAQTSRERGSANPSQFTDYPSKAGALFQWANNAKIRVAYVPFWTAFTWVDDTPDMFWAELEDTHETCPAGYVLSDGTPVNFRRPTDGATNTAVSYTGSINNVTDSEVRQSLFLNPLNGTDISNRSSIWGYYADGYFDRRKTATVSTAYFSAVATGTSDIAYIGTLHYNIYNNASLFFPFTGARISSGTSNVGHSANYWTSTSSSTTISGTAYMSKDSGSKTISRMHACPIRCVRP